jgi:RHS repeat-associated protein
LNAPEKLRISTTAAPVRAVHMNGRIYSPKLGRMLSPDPVTQAPENGQNYNRYSYAYNNPLRYTDPSGHFAVCAGNGCTRGDGERSNPFGRGNGWNGISFTGVYWGLDWNKPFTTPPLLPDGEYRGYLDGLGTNPEDENNDFWGRFLDFTLGDRDSEEGTPEADIPVVGSDEDPVGPLIRFLPVQFTVTETTVVDDSHGLIGTTLGVTGGALAGLLAGELDYQIHQIDQVTYLGSQKQVWDNSFDFGMITLENGETTASPTSRRGWVNVGDPVAVEEIHRETSYTITVRGDDIICAKGLICF